MMFVAMAGCSGESTTDRRARSVPSVGPRETAGRIRALHRAQQYRELESLVVRGRGSDVSAVLIALDDFLAANARLCAWTRANLGPGLSHTIDQSYIADDLGVYAGEAFGVFSLDAELLDEHISGDSATVSFAVPGRMPAQRARFWQTSDAVWKLDPPAFDADALVEAFAELARGLRMGLSELESDESLRKAAEADPQALVDKLAARLRSGVKALSKAQSALAEPGDGSTGG